MKDGEWISDVIVTHSYDHRDNVHQRILKVITALTPPESEQADGEDWSYQSHQAVTAEVGKMCVYYGLTFLPVRLEHILEPINGINARATVEGVWRITNIDAPSDYVDIEMVGSACNDPQYALASAVSTATRMAMQKAFMIPSSDKDIEEIGRVGADAERKPERRDVPEGEPLELPVGCKTWTSACEVAVTEWLDGVRPADDDLLEFIGSFSAGPKACYVWIIGQRALGMDYEDAVAGIEA